MNLADCLHSGKQNNLNLIRLLAALSVTFGHSFAMTHGSHHEIGFGINSAGFGFYAVAIFFGLSGFLITQSYFRRPDWKVFMKARLLRILPGYLFANFVTGLIIVFFILKNADLLFSKNFLLYFVGGTFHERDSFPDVFKHLHYNSTNGSMWTLPYEMRMYVLVLIFGAIGLLRKRWLFLTVCTLMTLVVHFQIELAFRATFSALLRIKTYDLTYLALPFSFALGMLAFVFKEQVRLNIPLAACILLLSFNVDHSPLKVFALIYASFCIGYLGRLYIDKLNFKDDISYGVYILSWPIQQTVLHHLGITNGLELFVTSTVIIIPLSWISWKLIEQPCLKLKFVNSKDNRA